MVNTLEKMNGLLEKKYVSINMAQMILYIGMDLHFFSKVSNLGMLYYKEKCQADGNWLCNPKKGG